MIPRPALAAVIFWQTSVLVNLGAPAAPEHLRYERAVRMPPDARGIACVALDATVLAHTASAAHNDLRLYRTESSGAPAQAGAGQAEGDEVPYLLTESGPEPLDAVQATIQHLVGHGNQLQFDLEMPAGPYSELQLQLRAHDFVGTVVVTGESAQGRTQPLGSFGIFDLHGAGLGRWTNLLLAESSEPVLHLTLGLRHPDGRPINPLQPDLLMGVAVPPSRERQTVYTPVASTNVFTQRGQATVATLHVPAHVPVEGMRFRLHPGSHPNFAREVLLTARADDEPFNDPETLDAGLFEEVRMPSGDPRLNPIDVRENSLHATLGATLGSAATVEVAVENGNAAPLPLQSVSLEMRERRLCFPLSPHSGYTLRYGDAALAAPLYPDPPQRSGSSVAAELGPERRNPQWTPRHDNRPFLDRHPEVFWLILLACAGMMGGTALQFVQHRTGEDRR